MTSATNANVYRRARWTNLFLVVLINEIDKCVATIDKKKLLTMPMLALQTDKPARKRRYTPIQHR